ncbi:glycosyltransferase [Pseudomonas moraviensis]
MYASLMMSNANSGVDILLIIEADIATTQLTEQLLLECARFGVRYKKVYLAQLDEESFSKRALPLFVRTADPVAVYWMEALRRSNIPYYFYIDDNFWLIDGDTPLAKYYRHPIIRRSLKFVVENANVIITNSATLKDFLLPKNVNTVLLPAFFDFSLLPIGQNETSSEYRIGFAGSPSREADLAVLRDVVPLIINKFDSVVFEFIGCFPRWLEVGPRVRFFEHMHSYADYIAFQARRGWKIGLAPLDSKSSNKYKTNNKYREYSAFRCAGIYSVSESYVGSVDEGVTGLLVEADSSDCWATAIECYINDEVYRASIAERAYADVHSRFELSVVASQWTALFHKGGNLLGDGRIKPVRVSVWNGIVKRISHYRLLIEISMYEGGAKLTLHRIINKVLGALKLR